MKSILKNRLFILFLIVLVVNIFLRNFMNYDLFKLSKKSVYEGYTQKKDLPCIDLPKNIDDPVELQTNISRLTKAITQTVGDVDNLIGESIKKKHSERLFKSRIESYFLKVEQNCPKIKLDGKEYTYKEIAELKNLSKDEKKKYDEYKKSEMKKFDDEVTEGETKKYNKLKNEILNNLKKFGNAYKKYSGKDPDSKKEKKKDIYLTQQKMNAALMAALHTGIPAYGLIVAVLNRLRYKPSFKKNRARYIIDSELTFLKDFRDLTKKLLKSKMYKEFTS